jgi:hypothetical protein
VINVIALLILARLVEPVYGSKEFLKCVCAPDRSGPASTQGHHRRPTHACCVLRFIFLVNLAVCSSVFATIYVTYAITASGDLLYHQFTGFHGTIAALLVVRQLTCSRPPCPADALHAAFGPFPVVSAVFIDPSAAGHHVVPVHTCAAGSQADHAGA